MTLKRLIARRGRAFVIHSDSAIILLQRQSGSVKSIKMRKCRGVSLRRRSNENLTLAEHLDGLVSSKE